MCIAYFRFQPEDEVTLFIAANRDEFHGRPTAFADVWAEDASIIAGRDLEAGGTWLAISRHGGIGLLTNIRDPLTLREQAKSRGLLVLNSLDYPHQLTEQQFLTQQGDLSDYNAFNLIFGDGRKLFYLNNYHALRESESEHEEQDQTLIELPAGRYTLSNADLYTQWPKTEALGRGIDDINIPRKASELFADLNHPSVHDFKEAVFAALANTTQAPDNLLPQTGIGDELEKLLSSPFIVSPDYGTRCSTIVLCFRNGARFMVERSFDPEGQVTHEVLFYLSAEGQLQKLIN